jgi:uncharacterized protein (TIGR02646 family)
MIELIHCDTPRLLDKRKNNPSDNGIPLNPQNAWGSFSTEGKKEIHNSLTPLQNGLCVYCEQKLSMYSFHIEHILSKSLNPFLTFEYTNLSLSCIEDGSISDETTTNPISCGHSPLKRINEYDETLFIKPTEQNCNALFRYKHNGEITYAKNLSQFDIDRVEHTIEVLNLDCLRLKRDRRETIEEGLNSILELEDNSEALANFLDLEFEKVNNKYVFPFISAREEHYNLWRG